jgi:hypothetical protein
MTSARVVPRGLPMRRLRIGSRKRSGLPAAGLGAAQDVTALDGRWKCLGLDWRGTGEAELFDSAQETWVQLETGKRHELSDGGECLSDENYLIVVDRVAHAAVELHGD